MGWSQNSSSVSRASAHNMDGGLLSDIPRNVHFAREADLDPETKRLEQKLLKLEQFWNVFKETKPTKRSSLREAFTELTADYSDFQTHRCKVVSAGTVMNVRDPLKRLSHRVRSGSNTKNAFREAAPDNSCLYPSSFMYPMTPSPEPFPIVRNSHPIVSPKKPKLCALQRCVSDPCLRIHDGGSWR